MRGQRLFIRPIENGDREVLQGFLKANGEDWTPHECGLLGKLVGDVVAAMSLEVTEDALRIDQIVVAKHLRRKWIGRSMVDEAQRLAAKLDRGALVIRDARDAREFFERLGFVDDGNGLRRTG